MQWKRPQAMHHLKVKIHKCDDQQIEMEINAV